VTERLSVIQHKDGWAVWDSVSQLLLCVGSYDECLTFKQNASKQLDLDLLGTQKSVVVW